MEAFLVSTGVVALGEIGDKTQLLALVLAARFRRPWPIIAGILAATLANHTLAGLLGSWVRGIVTPETLRWLVATSFFAVAIWALIPDTLDDDGPQPSSRLGIFGPMRRTRLIFAGASSRIAAISLERGLQPASDMLQV